MKHQLIYIILTATLFYTCSEKTPKKFVHQFDRTKTIGRNHKLFYSPINVIFTPNNKMFFHSKDSLLNCCDTGEDYDYPDYIGLEPDDLSSFYKKDLIKTIQLLSSKKTDDKYSIQIALYSDTIKNSEFGNLLSIMDSLRFDNYDVRVITEEEKVVLDHKENGQPYNFYKIRWTSRFSNTVFPPPPPPDENQ